MSIKNFHVKGKKMAKKVKVGVIAAGGRSQGVVANLLRDSDRNAEIVAVFDPDRKEAERAKSEIWKSPDCRICASPEEVVNIPEVEWVMIFSPNAHHREHIELAFNAGKHVFSEKPLATSIADCQSIYLAHQAHPELKFATGFVLRYAPIYRKAKEILDSGVLGKLLLIQANENITPEHGGYIMCNWRRFTSEAGPHILEKCCHDLDLIDWFCESKPSRIASFGHRAFFVPENEKLMEKYGEKTFVAWRDPHAAPSPFTSEKDLMDVQGAIAEFRNGVIVNFVATMSNPKPERRMYFSCTEGTMTVELYSSTLTYRSMGEEVEYSMRFGADGHGGGDDYIMKELYASMSEGVLPKCSGNEGLESAVFALAIDQAACEGGIVDLEPVWKSLGR